VSQAEKIKEKVCEQNVRREKAGKTDEKNQHE
jgi:hypothetical protein